MTGAAPSLDLAMTAVGQARGETPLTTYQRQNPIWQAHQCTSQGAQPLCKQPIWAAGDNPHLMPVEQGLPWHPVATGLAGQAIPFIVAASHAQALPSAPFWFLFPLFWLPLLPRCAPPPCPLCLPLPLLVWLLRSVCLRCSSPCLLALLEPLLKTRLPHQAGCSLLGRLWGSGGGGSGLVPTWRRRVSAAHRSRPSRLKECAGQYFRVYARARLLRGDSSTRMGGWVAHALGWR